MLTSAAVKTRALELGFDLCGIAPAAAFPELGRLPSWLRSGYAGTMTYLNRTARVRADVRGILPAARSVVAVACVYNVDRPYSTEIADPRQAQIARYAWGADYHDVMGARLGALAAWMRAAHGEPFESRAYVDTGPVQERVYAQYAGLGWIGKNTCLISPDHGSWLLLGEIICGLPLEPDAPGFDRCGTCTLCLEACPSSAFVGPGVLDSRRCLSYQTIEFRGAIPEDLRARLGARVFGCDVCQDVCPWNATAVTTTRPEWAPRAALDRPAIADLWEKSDTELEDAVSGSPLARPGIVGLRRNLAVALGNTGDPTLRGRLDRPPTETDLPCPSCDQPLVLEHIRWAAARLAR